MHEALAILICLLSVFGLYALFSRLAVALLPRGVFTVAIDGAGKTAEEILLSVLHARILLERETRFAEHVAVLLDAADEETITALRKEGILICMVHKEKN